MKFIIEGYRTDQEKPVYRAQAKGLLELANKMNSAFLHSKAHFIIVRKVS